MEGNTTLTGAPSHPLLVHRAALQLCRRSRWTGDWQELCRRERYDWSAILNIDRARYADGEPVPLERKVERDVRIPPLPFYASATEGQCRVCGQPVYPGKRWRRRHRQSPRGTWHWVCWQAYDVWTRPGDYRGYLAEMQGGVCPYSGSPLWTYDAERDQRPLVSDVEVDHHRPLWELPFMMVSWPRVLDYWGPENLRAVVSVAHAEKTRREASRRAAMRSLAHMEDAGQEGLAL